MPVGTSIEVPSEILKELRKVHGGYRYFDSEGGQAVQQVPPECIPEEVKDEGYDWIRKIIRSGWLPRNTQEILKGETRLLDVIPPERVDFLGTDYAVAGGRLCVLENGASLAILWKNPNIQVGEDPGKTAIFLAQCLLRIPENRVRDIKAFVRRGDDPEGRLFVGILRIEKRSKEEYRYWYNHMTVWLAPGLFYVTVAERDGTPPGNPQANPGIRRRFLESEEGSLMGRRIASFPSFSLANVTLKEAVAKLSREAKVPICLETIPHRKGTPQERVAAFAIRAPTVDDVLKRIFGADSPYYSEENDGIINVIPRQAKEDPAYPLNRRIARFWAENKPLRETLNELIRLARESGVEPGDFGFGLGGNLKTVEAFYNTPVTLSIEDATIREILNAIARQVGSCNWSYVGVIGRRNFGFLPL